VLFLIMRTKGLVGSGVGDMEATGKGARLNKGLELGTAWYQRTPVRPYLDRLRSNKMWRKEYSRVLVEDLHLKF
jgi:hypothetical protein